MHYSDRVKRRRTKGYPTLAADLVARFIDKREGRKKGEALALKVFAAFHQIDGPIREQAEPVFFRAGLLTLNVTHSAWMTELTFLKEEIIERLNAIVGPGRVKDLRFRLGTVPPRVEAPTAKPLSDTLKQRGEALAADIADPNVRAAVAAAAARGLQNPTTDPPPPGPPGPRARKPDLIEPESEPTRKYGYGDRQRDRWKGRKPRF